MTSLPFPGPLPERTDVTAAVFMQDVLGTAQPLVMRGLVQHWPAVAAATEGDRAFVDYLATCPTTRPVPRMTAPAKEAGRFFYNPQVTDFNFKTDTVPLIDVLEQLLDITASADAPTIAVQSQVIPELMPRFASENQLDLVPHVAPRIWIGNRVKVAAHFDLKENIACCVSGQRRFTLFPPAAISGLYSGPFELTPAGTPVSMVDIDNPDMDRFPRFPAAWSTARQVTLTPGDALYIPYGWWHAVESLAPLSTLINYWWSDADTDLAGPYDALLHALFAYRHLPVEQRAVWKTLIDHYVFEANGDPGAHLPLHARGILAPASKAVFARLRAMLRQAVR